MLNHSKLRTLALSLALMTGATGVVHAAPADGATGPAATTAERDGPRAHRHHDGKHRGGPGMHHRGHDAGPLMMLGKLKGKLNLTSEQQTRWAAAEAQSREAGKAAREQRAEDRKQFKTQLDAAGPLDLRALSARRQASQAAIKPRMDAARDAWLVAYDSLDAKQKQVVTDAFKQRLAKADKRGGPRGEPRRGDGKPAAPPADARG